MRTTAHHPSRTSQLAAQAQRLRVLFDRLPTQIGYWDRNLVNLVANRAYAESLGLTPDQLQGRHIKAALGEHAYSRHEQQISGALAGIEQLFSHTVHQPNGDVRHLQFSYLPDQAGGEVDGFYVLITDVTARVAAQNALARAERLAGVGSWTYEVATDHLTWSEELYRIHGLDPADFVPTSAAVRALVHPEDRERAELVADRSLALDEGYELEYRVVRPDGSVHHLRAHGEPTFSPDGLLVRLRGTVQDITEIVRAARAVARTDAELDQVHRLNADVIGMLGHDVQQPLTVILGYLEELVGSWTSIPEPSRREYASTVLQAANRLRCLVDDIVAMASLDSGSIATHPETLDPAVILRQALENVAGGQGVVVESHTRGRVRFDPFHLRQILTNLLSNAVRYGSAPVVVTLDEVDGAVELTVCDHGEGVPEEYLPHLFERFSRAASGAAAHVRGSGFGLYLARQLAEANGAELGYRAHLPHGARFTLRLPGQAD